MWPGPFEQTLNPLLPRCCKWNLIKIGPVISEEKMFENVDKHSILVINEWSWPLTFTEVHVVPTFISQITIVLGKCDVPPVPHSISQGTKFDLGKKMGQGQHRVTIWRNLVVLNQLTLHIKFQADQPSGSWEDLLRFLPYMGTEAMLIMWPWPFEQISDPHIVNLPLPGWCKWNLIATDRAVSEKSFENDNTFNLSDLLSRPWMTLAFGIYRGAWSTFFHITEYHCLVKIHCFTISPFKA